MLSPATSLPRIWIGLWQLSSNAWGSAPAPKVRDAMATHMGKGFFAFGELCSAYAGVCRKFTDNPSDRPSTDMVSRWPPNETPL